MREFKLAEPRALDQLTALIGQGGDSFALMAGGTDLLGEMKEGIIGPDVVIDLSTVSNLSFIRKEKTRMRIGAMTTLADLAGNGAARGFFPGLHQALRSAATPQIRNVGTVAGNLCQRPRCWYYRDGTLNCRKKGGSRCFAFRGKNKFHAILGGGMCHIVHPSDLAPVLIALRAEVAILTPGGEKTVPIQNFFTLPDVDVRRENILEPADVITEIRIPLPRQGEKSTYIKFKERGTWDFAVISAAVSGIFEGNLCREIRIVAGGVAPVPWRFIEIEKKLNNQKITDGLVRLAARSALAQAKPLADNGYKGELAETILSRAVLSLI